MVGLHVDLSCASIFLVCVFYTSVGGMKAVVWTDVFQLVFMFVSVLSIVIVATAAAGGPGHVWAVSYGEGRVGPSLLNLAADPRERHTVWGITMGMSILWLSIFGVSQTQVQR